MTKIDFCTNFIYLNRKLISFEGRPYLRAIYEAEERNLVLRWGRQTEKSTFLANTMAYEAWKTPGCAILFVCPRQEQARTFSKDRLLPVLQESPFLRRTLLGKKAKVQVKNYYLENGSKIYIRSAYTTGDGCRGLSADLLLIDEVQDAAAGHIPVLQETMSHASKPRTILTGTPKLLSNHLDTMFRLSTANEWTITCPQCARGAILDERSLGPRGLVCPECGAAIDPRAGRWVPRHPQATWGVGYWVGHPMVPWMKYDTIMEKQRTYDLAKFKNEVLGLPTSVGDHVVTLEELKACCGADSMDRPIDELHHSGQGLIAGIDWGGGTNARTALVIGYLDPECIFHVVRFERFRADEAPNRVVHSVAECCRQYRVHAIAADGDGNGHVWNGLLLDQLDQWQGLTAILYSSADQAPKEYGRLIKWTVNRSQSIGQLFTRIKTRKIVFPRVEECATYLDEFACVYVEYDDYLHSVRYLHPENQPDDAMHATNYAMLLSFWMYHDIN